MEIRCTQIEMYNQNTFVAIYAIWISLDTPEFVHIEGQEAPLWMIGKLQKGRFKTKKQQRDNMVIN